MMETCDAKEALAALERKLEGPPPPGYERIFVISKSQSHVGPRAIVDAARDLGLRFMGRSAFRTLYPFTTIRREAWLDPDGIVRLSIRDEHPGPILARKLSKYNLTTYFDDGTLVTTWSSREPLLARDDIAWNRAGTEDLRADFTSHMAAVSMHANAGRKPMRIEDLETIVALARYFELRLYPEATSRYLARRRSVVRWIFVSALLGALFGRFLVWRKRRR